MNSIEWSGKFHPSFIPHNAARLNGKATQEMDAENFNWVSSRDLCSERLRRYWVLQEVCGKL